MEALVEAVPVSVVMWRVEERVVIETAVGGQLVVVVPRGVARTLVRLMVLG